MSTKHEGFTPGPWRFEKVRCAGRLVYARIGPATKGSVAYSGVYGPDKSNALLPETEALANARLIADAPRLYAENQRLRDALARVAAALDADGRTTDGCTKADAVARLRAALTGDDA